jgi:hypothetical protein
MNEYVSAGEASRKVEAQRDGGVSLRAPPPTPRATKRAPAQRNRAICSTSYSGAPYASRRRARGSGARPVPDAQQNASQRRTTCAAVPYAFYGADESVSGSAIMWAAGFGWPNLVRQISEGCTTLLAGGQRRLWPEGATASRDSRRGGEGTGPVRDGDRGRQQRAPVARAGRASASFALTVGGAPGQMGARCVALASPYLVSPQQRRWVLRLLPGPRAGVRLIGP